MKSKSNKTWRCNSVALFDKGVTATEGGDLHITATLKVFNRPNGNNEIAAPTAYDKFIASYYGAGGYQLPLCYMHDEKHIIGAVSRIERDEERLNIEAVVFHSAPDFDYLRDLIARGVLGGVSDGSYAHGYIDDDGAFHVTEAEMCEVSLVTVPAEILAGVEVSNTIVEGFTPNENKEEERGGFAALLEDRMFND